MEWEKNQEFRLTSKELLVITRRIHLEDEKTMVKTANKEVNPLRIQVRLIEQGFIGGDIQP